VLDGLGEVDPDLRCAGTVGAGAGLGAPAGAFRAEDREQGRADDVAGPVEAVPDDLLWRGGLREH